MALPTSIESDAAAYELEVLVRESLSLGGVVAAAIHLRQPSGEWRTLAAALAENSFDDSTNLGEAGAQTAPADLFVPRSGSPFADSTLKSPGMREVPLDEALAHLPASVLDVLRKSLGAVFALVARLDAEDGPLGIMLFILDHPTTDDERQVMQAFVLDASRALDALVRSNEVPRHRHRQRMGALLSISEAAVLSKDSDLSSTLQAIIDRLRSVLSADAAVVQLLSDDGRTATPAAVSVSAAGRASGVLDRIWAPLFTGSGITGWVVRTGRAALAANLATDSRGRPRPDRPPESVMAAPLSTGGALIGVLRVSALGPARFGPAELQLVELLGQQVTVAVENARLYQSARDQNAELLALYEQTREQKGRLAIFGHMFAASPDAIILVGPDEEIQECNSAAERLYGYEATELIGQPLRMLLAEAHPWPQRTSPRTGPSRPLRNRGEWRGEVRERRKSGAEFLAEVERSIVHDESGRPLGSIRVSRDLTERKQLEAQSLQSEKLRSLGVMASGVAHQMNNVLASVVGQADVLRAELPDVATQQRLDAIIQAAQDGAEAVRRIQRFARNAPQEHFAPVDLPELIDDVVRATAPRLRDASNRIGTPIKLRVDAEQDVWTSGLAADLREVTMNLVLNAVDALPDGGTITIGLQPVGDSACLTVADDGIGMPEDVAARAFEPFFTTKPAGKGTGLGLALAYGTVQRHGGKIAVQTTIGGGTRFEIFLPRVPSPEREMETVDEPLRVAPSRMLIVDDEPPLANQLRTIFTPDGHDVEVCTSGEAALAALAAREFDVVLTDLGMPEVTGWDVASAAKKRLPNVRVGLITGWAEELDDARALAARGVDFVIAKPYRMDEVRAATAQAILSVAHV